MVKQSAGEGEDTMGVDNQMRVNGKIIVCETGIKTLNIVFGNGGLGHGTYRRRIEWYGSLHEREHRAERRVLSPSVVFTGIKFGNQMGEK
jgi:hypothetical protein